VEVGVVVAVDVVDNDIVKNSSFVQIYYCFLNIQ
jgi:hypothetical protein